NSMFILISVGMCLVIMTGGIDLSVGTVAALSSVMAALASTRGLAVALPAGVATGLLVGAVNAGLIVGVRLPPFMATLASMLAAKGAALVISDSRAVPVDWASDFTALGMNKIGPLVPWTIVIAVVVVVAAWYALERTSLGRTVLAVGGNAEAAHLMGLKTGRALVFVYLFSGACAGLAGVFLASGYGAGQPLEGLGWELAAIASVVVGGTLLTGGMGSVPATVAGALLFGLVFNMLNFENGLGVISLSAYWQSVIRGAFLLVVILLQVRLARPAAHKA
ncbi:MAG TPA: ABC transporter permease, partial [Rubellimicrobium sp.]|nr:ABC transporter permease [Rubellimicrobium sp.]